jgi:organic radical activating enzyme
MSEKFKQTQQLLNTVSPTLCLAKWQQVTIHLQNGHTHSCHHPQTHKIPLEELKDNPSALHNTKYKKEQRKLMLEGKRPIECHYCWTVEDAEGEHYSDRIKKSANKTWAEPYFNEVKLNAFDYDVIPKQIEVSFGNVCNMKCLYCGPVFSSEWQSEIKHHGAYPTQDRYNNLEWIAETERTPYLNRERNPYVDAWWKWWPEIKDKLKILRITGGEPLLNHNTQKLLNDIQQNPLPELKLEINSNLAIVDKLLKDFVIQLKVLVQENKIKDFRMYTSCDTQGKHAEYIREGLVYSRWLANCEYVLQNDIPVHVMITANSLCIDHFYNFMQDLYKLKEKYNLTYGVSLLNNPSFLDVRNLPKTGYWTAKFNNVLAYVSENKFTNSNELNYITRLRNYYMNGKLTEEQLKKNKSDLRKFVREIDRRRNKNFTNTFITFVNHTS